MSEKNKAFARRWFEEVWNKGNLDVIGEFFGDNYVNHTAGSPDARGVEPWRETVSTARAAFPDLRFTIDDQIAEGDKLMNRWTFRGTHQGEYMGVPPTGKQITVTGISINRFAGGKYVESWSVMDTLGMMQQLGALPPLEESEK